MRELIGQVLSTLARGVLKSPTEVPDEVGGTAVC
jgi:hypothetical protein